MKLALLLFLLVFEPRAGEGGPGSPIPSKIASQQRFGSSLLVDGVLKYSDTTAPYEFSWNTALWPEGVHTLESRAWDACGNRARSGVLSVSVLREVPPATPAITVRQAWDGLEVPPGSTFTFPDVAAGVALGRRFAIGNPGSAPLHLTSPTALVSGACFSQVLTETELPVSPVPPGGTTYFRVRRLYAAAGTSSGLVAVASDAPGASPYAFALLGTVTP